MKEIRVEVAYAAGPEPDRQQIAAMSLPAGATVADAIRAAHVTDRFPDANLGVCSLAIYGERVAPDHVLRDGERVEICRPLVADVKAALRARKAPKLPSDY